MNFSVFKSAIAKQFERMQKYPMFRMSPTIEEGEDADAKNAAFKYELWVTYLHSFPAGTNPVYRERPEHDCGCCKQFIRSIGDVVAVIDGKLETVWNIDDGVEPGYRAVASRMNTFVLNHAVHDEFLHYERTAGTDKSFEKHVDGVKTWEHFFVNIKPQFVVAKQDLATRLSISRSTHDVFLRSLKELTLESLNIVLELTADKALYRGEENAFVVTEFRKLKIEFDKLQGEFAQNMFAWVQARNVRTGSILAIRNTAIGTLLTDLSEGKDIDASVNAFEFKVSGGNYKRPTALVTQKMIDSAKATLAGMGLTSALARRYATLRDITANNILFANRDARKAMSGDVFDDISSQVSTKVKNLDCVEEVTIERFVGEILPNITSLEVLLENKHANNFVSLIAPEDPTAGHLFKWDNNFSWSYANLVADSIKEKVKKAGGRTEGDLCCRLAWDYSDDLDFHMHEPDGYHIDFRNRRALSRSGGVLDVDANGADGPREDPVENIVYEDRKRMKEGIYTLEVNNYNRKSGGSGFEVEIEFDGQVHSIAYSKVLRDSETVLVAKIKYSKSEGFQLLSSLDSKPVVRTMWGLQSWNFHNVNVMLLSPNHWDDHGVGNKHYFFMLDGCKNDGLARGFYNEFLKEEFTKHRKVFEVVGSKMIVKDSPDQLSGLGFSSTQKNALVCRVKGSFTRTLKVVF